MKSLLLTKHVIQQRANQLVRELHGILDHDATVQLLQDRKNRGPSKRGQQYDSLVDCHSVGSGSTSNGKARTTVQTGLKAFFSPASGKPSSSVKRSKLIVLNDEDVENGSPTDSLASIGGKRKESPVANDSASDDDDFRTDKKPKNNMTAACPT
jgi:hypothetical protein